jgi:hypothetical protein
MSVLSVFKQDDYNGEMWQIGKFLSSMTPLTSWTKEEAQKIRKKAYKFFLKEGHLWRLPKRTGGAPLRVIGNTSIF